jgi:hypothetical protein
MANPKRKPLDPAALALKEQSVGRMLEKAQALHQKGQLRKVAAPAKSAIRQAEPLRVRSVKP